MANVSKLTSNYEGSSLNTISLAQFKTKFGVKSLGFFRSQSSFYPEINSYTGEPNPTKKVGMGIMLCRLTMKNGGDAERLTLLCQWDIQKKDVQEGNLVVLVDEDQDPNSVEAYTIIREAAEIDIMFEA